MAQWVQPVTLTGSRATLEPLSTGQAAGLREAAADGDLHRLWYTSVPSPDRVEAEIARRLGLQDAGSMMPFCITDTRSGQPIGMTTYMNIDQANRRLEIGSTWYRASVQRSGVNTECKHLLLTHAFETLEAVAVEFRTHFMNRQSRAAIERLGAKQDGILRSHMILPDGSLRDTVVYSIIRGEWPAVKANLQWMLDKPQ
jgi:RimJ/RimL family protein N-acetyltransferase